MFEQNEMDLLLEFYHNEKRNLLDAKIIVYIDGLIEYIQSIEDQFEYICFQPDKYHDTKFRFYRLFFQSYSLVIIKYEKIGREAFK